MKIGVMLDSFDNHDFMKSDGRAERPGEPTDIEILKRMAVGDEAALTMLAERHRVLLRTVIARVVLNDYDVDDVLQETLLDAWDKASHYSKEKGQVIGWLITIARRRAIDRIRRKLTYCRATERLGVHEMIFGEKIDSHTAESDAATDDLREIFTELMNELPTAQREAISLNMYGGLTQRQIAAKTHTPLGTIKTRLELAIRKIRKAIVARAPRSVWIQELTA